MSEKILNTSLEINKQLSAEVDALKKYAKQLKSESELAKKASVKAPSFSEDALSKAADILVDSGFLKSASKAQFVELCKATPDKALEALEKVASATVKPAGKPEAVGRAVEKSASWFSVKSASKEDPYKDCFQRY